MRDWAIPVQWADVERPESKMPQNSEGAELVLQPMRRQPLRRSAGFLQIDNIFAEIDAAQEDYDSKTTKH